MRKITFLPLVILCAISAYLFLASSDRNLQAVAHESDSLSEERAEAGVSAEVVQLAKVVSETGVVEIEAEESVCSHVGHSDSSGVDAVDLLDVEKPILGDIAGSGVLQQVLEHLETAEVEKGFVSADFVDAIVTDNYQSRHNGVNHVYLRQRFEGIEVYGSDLSIHLTESGEVLTVNSRFIPKFESLVAGQVSKLSASSAIGVAADALNLTYAQSPALKNSFETLNEAQVFLQPEISQDDIPVKLVYYAKDKGEPRLAWNMVLNLHDQEHWYDLNVDAATGEILSKANWVAHAGYHVLPIPVRTPEDGARQLLTNPHDVTASPYGWHDTDGVAGAEYTDTRGNNVYAQDDLDANNTGGTRPDGGAGRAGLVFDNPLDLALSPDNYLDASITNLFYWNNVMHDVHYHYGFDESSGNFQENNYGNGGTGGDPVQADAQDGSGTNNANFSTPPDGSDPRMQMFNWTYATPYRDSTFDTMIIAHEYGHGISNRLTGGASNSSALTENQSRGMGEGWSDWWGLVMTAVDSDNEDTARPVGTYVKNQPASGAGIRPAPYSTDMGTNSLTYGALNGGGLSVPHGIGTVWCTVLWDMYWKLVDKYGYDPDLYHGTGGNNIAMLLVMDGLKLQPSNPTYLDARDAILLADQVNNGSANHAEIWQAFARRGMGFSADDGGSASSLSVTEAFDIADDFVLSSSGDVVFEGVIGGPYVSANVEFSLSNTGSAPLDWEITGGDSWMDLSSSRGTLAAGSVEVLTVSLTALADTLPIDSYSTVLRFENLETNIWYEETVQLNIEPITEQLFFEDFETGLFDPAYWTVTGTATYRTEVTSANVPHTGTYHVVMDSSVSSSYSRNELTLSLDLSNREHVFLKFWTKEFNEEYDGPPSKPFITGADFDGIAISEDGSAWYEVLPLSSLTAVYEEIEIDLDAAILANGLSYNSDFKIRFNQYDTHTAPTDGFAFDDIEVVASPSNRLSIDLPEEHAEGDGSLTATVFLENPLPSDLSVSLGSSDSSELSVDPTVVIPAGAIQATFNYSIVDDALLDGSQLVTISSSATGITGTPSDSVVHDNETATITVSLPSLATEGGGVLVGAGSITLSTAPDSDVVIDLSSGDTSELSVATTVSVLAGQTSAVFDLIVIDDGEIDGSQSTSVTASVYGWTAGSDVMSVVDNENTDLAFTAPSSSYGEGEVTANGSLSISGTLASDLVISLGSDDTSEVTVPSEVTILAGETSVAVPLTLIDDALTDGSQSVTLTASASGFTDDLLALTILDDDLDHIVFDSISGNQLAGEPFSVTLRALTVDGVPATDFTGVVFLSAAGDSGSVTVAPVLTTAFVDGVWTGDVTISELETAVVLTAFAGAEFTADSDSFDVTYGPLAYFEWGAIPVTQYQGNPIAVSIEAKDSHGFTVSDYAGVANLSSSTFGDASFTAWGDHTYSQTWPGSRTRGLVVIPSEDITVTHIRHFFGSACGIWNSLGNLLTSEDFSATAGSWSETTLSSPVTLTAGQTYIIGVFGATLEYNYSISSSSFSFAHGSVPSARSTDVGSSSLSYPNLLNAWHPMIDFKYSTSDQVLVPITPTVTTAFAAGQWSGSITMQDSGDGLSLTAQDGSITGESNSFDTLALALSVGVAAAVDEGQAGLTGSVTLPVPISVDLSIDLSSSDTSEITVQPSVTLVAGDVSVDFNYDTVDDGILDGTRTVSIGAATADINAGVSMIDVDDVQSATLSLVPDSSTILESSGTLGFTVSSTAPFSEDITILLSSDDPTSMTLPDSVILLGGQTSVDFDATVINNTKIDGARTVTASASVVNWTGGVAPIQINDDETRTIALSVPENVAEDDWALVDVGIVTISGTLDSALEITLSSSAYSYLALPTLVTIAAGETSQTFTLLVVDDTLENSNRLATVTASAATFSNAVEDIEIIDDELHHFDFAPVASSQIENEAFTITITAANTDGDRLDEYIGSLLLNARGDGGVIPMTPTETSAFISGEWSGEVTMQLHDTQVEIVADDPYSGHVGISDPFTVFEGAEIDVTPAAINVIMDADTTQTEVLTIENNGGVALDWVSSVGMGASARLASPEIFELEEITFDNIVGGQMEPTAADSTLGLSSPATYFALPQADEAQVILENSVAPVKVLMDVTHGILENRHPDGVYSTLKSLLAASQIQFESTAIGLENVDLSQYDVVVIAVTSTGTSSYTPEEGALVRQYVEQGGGLWLLGDHSSYSGNAKIVEIASVFGVTTGGSNLSSTPLVIESHQVTEGVTSLSTGGWGSLSSSSSDIMPIVTTGSLIGALVGEVEMGRVAVVGDVNYCDNTYIGSADHQQFTLNLIHWLIEADGSPQWLSLNPESGSVSSGGSETVDVIVDTTDLLAGDYSATITLTSNDHATPTVDVPVSLTVIGIPEIEVDSASLDFSDVIVGSSADLDLTITNTGSDLLDVASIAASGYFSSGETGGFSLSPDESITVSVSFAPLAVGSQVGTLTILSNDITDPSLVVGLTGIGVVGPLEYLEWEPIADAKLNQDIPVIITAKDINGNTVTDFTDTVGLSAFVGGGFEAGSMLNSSTPGSSFTGTHNMGYAFTPSVDMEVTHFSHCSGISVSLWTDAGVLLKRQTVVSTPGTWVNTELDAPVQLTANTRYRIAAYTGGGSWYYGTEPLTTFDHGVIDQGYYISSSDGFPTTSHSGDRFLVDMQYRVGSSTSVGMDPADSGDFVAGVWDGTVRLQEVASQVTIEARHLASGVSSISNPFDVSAIGALSLTLPPSASEADGVLVGQAMITVSPTPSVDTTVQLTSLNTDKLTVASSIVIPAGQSNVPVDLTLIDNDLLDGTVSVAISIEASGYSETSQSINVEDNESITFYVSVPSFVIESSGVVTGQIYTDIAPTIDVSIDLTSGDLSEIVTPATVLLSAGQFASDTFDLTVVDDTEIDGLQVVEITASMGTLNEDTVTMSVIDNESSDIQLSSPASVTEGDGVLPSVCIVSISGTLPDDLTVQLTSGDSSELSVPASVVIPAGDTSISFDLTVLNDSIADGPQSTTVSASATNFVAAQNVIIVNNDDPDHFTFSNISNLQTVLQGFPIELTARESNGDVVSAFSGIANLSASGNLGAAVMSPVVTGNFISGVWNGTVSIHEVDTQLSITADFDAVTGASNQFDVAKPVMAVTPLQIVETIVEGESVTLDLDISNTGPVNLNWSLTTSISPWISLSSTTGTSASGQTETVNVTLDASALTFGAHQGFITINSNDLDNLVLSIPVDLTVTKAVDHFELSTIASPQFIGSPFDVTIEAKASDGSTVPEFNETVDLETVIDGGTQFVFEDDFEDGDLNGWQNTANFSIDSSIAADASQYSISCDSSSSHYRGAVHSLNSETPEKMSFYVRTASNILNSGYVVLMDNLATNDETAVFFYFHDSGEMRVVSDIHYNLGSYVANEWYFIELTFDWPNYQLNASVNGIEVATNIAFRGGSSVNAIQEVHLYNYSTTQAWWDEIKLYNGDAIVPIAMSPTQTTAFTNGVWSGQVTVEDGALSATLVATDDSQNEGSSNAFDIVPPIPVIDAEPPYTGGLENTLFWSPSHAAIEYELQSAENSNFASPTSSGWTVENDVTVTALVDESEYYYRLRARDDQQIESPWSPVVASTQDAQPPIVNVTSPQADQSYLLSDELLVMGTTEDFSGVSAFTVNSNVGELIVTSPNVYDWNYQLENLQVGTNPLEISISDNAVPPNVTTLNWTLERMADSDGDLLPDSWEIAHGLNPNDNGSISRENGDLGDGDRDRVSNLLEYLLNLDPQTASANGLPYSEVVRDMNDGKQYLHFMFRRRMNFVGVNYRVKVSDDLITWNSTEPDWELLSSTPVGDGETEIVVLKIKPSIDDSSVKKLFIRLSVEQ